MIEDISHITFIVHDLERATRFFSYIFDAEEVYSSGDRNFSLSREKFFRIGGLWVAVMEGESLPNRTYNHIAFKVPEEEFETYQERIRLLGVQVRTPRKRVEGEGRSIYFYDFDNHLFELHTGTLTKRLECYGK
ncbi:MAG: Glyoxalase-like domain containing protein [Firmicutes bacterium]|nr:Glyoxalase-like domain containing protein [Bacillota bacterium]